jgi:hypothetical protein
MAFGEAFSDWLEMHCGNQVVRVIPNKCADLGDTGTIRRLISTISARLLRDLRGMSSKFLNIVGFQLRLGKTRWKELRC